MKFLEDLYEWGGGRGGPADFQRRHINYLGERLEGIHDPIIREHFSLWLFGVLRTDAERNTEKVMKRSFASRSRPEFQQRHFYFLAYHVSCIGNPYMREFAREWLGNVCGGTNYKFQQDRWDRFCEPGAS